MFENLHHEIFQIKLNIIEIDKQYKRLKPNDKIERIHK